MLSIILGLLTGGLKFVMKLLGALKPALPYLAAAAVGAFLWNFTPVIGPNAKIAQAQTISSNWQKAAGDWKSSSIAWKASFRKSEGFRDQEGKTAIAAASSLVKQCSARVEEARASARVIERIVTTPPRIVEGCPARDLVDPALIEQALRPSR